MSRLKRTVWGTTLSTALSLSTAVAMSGAAYFAPIAVYAQSAADLQAQIQALLAQIATLQSQLSSLQGGGAAVSCNFTRNLTVGMTGDDVMCLQKYLNGAGYQVAASGAGSPGNETTYFGSLTKAAVAKWQDAHKAQVLTPVGLAAGTGYWGAGSRAHYNTLVAAAPAPAPAPAPGTPPPPAPAGTGLTVAAGAHPSNSLAPAPSAGGAARVPFTVVNFTASSDGDVTVNSLTVERTGLGSDSNFADLVIIDENGDQIGNAKTLNSAHQVKTGGFTVKAGQTKRVTLAGNMASGGNSGEVVSLTLVAVDTSAKVNGSLPITGASHTVNTTLSLGTVTVAKGSYDPGASDASVQVGTEKTTTGVQLTVGSNEKVKLESIRFNQAGSAGVSDLKDVKVNIGGTDYAATAVEDGKYYVVRPTTPIEFDKGALVQVYVKVTVAGGSDRTLDFNLEKKTDVVVKGSNFGYYITANCTSCTTGSGSSVAEGDMSTNKEPFYNAYDHTISTGTLNVEAAASVPAQNVAENISNEVIGGFTVEVKGEEISVGKMIFNVLTGTGTGNTADLTNVSLFNENGAIVAGPVDGSGTGTGGTITFSDTVIFPIGKGTYVLKGKYGTDFVNNDTVQASTTPSSDWTTVKGVTTGKTVSPTPTSAVTSKIMTVKAAALTISVQSVPLAQNVVAGFQQFTFANYEFNATQSGEDVKLASIPLEFNLGGGSASDLTACTLYDGSTKLTTGSNVVNPSAAASSTTFTFDGNGLIIPKGTTKVVALKCNIASGATGKYTWGYDSGSSPTPVGVTSNQSFSPTENDSPGQTMTGVANGNFTVVDDNTPGYRIVSANTTGVTLARLKFSATQEDVDIKRVALQLTTTASNTPLDLVGSQVTLWDETANKQIGTALFTNNGDFATSSIIATGDFRVTKDGSRTMLVKGDVANISASGPMTASGDLLKVDYDGNANGLNGGNYGVGVGSGQNISPSSSDTTVSGVRIFKAYPTFAKIDLSSSEKVLQNATLKTLYKFKVTATDGDVAFAKFTFRLTSSTKQALIKTWGLYAYTDSSFSSVDTAFSSDGLLNYGNCASGNVDLSSASNNTDATPEIYPDKGTTACSATTTYTVPNGQTRYFKLTGTVTRTETGTGTETVNVQLDGDAAINNNVIAQAIDGTKPVDSDTNDDLIWSPRSTSTTAAIGDLDWTNGYLLPGLPTTNMAAETLESAN